VQTKRKKNSIKSCPWNWHTYQIYQHNQPAPHGSKQTAPSGKRSKHDETI